MLPVVCSNGTPSSKLSSNEANIVFDTIFQRPPSSVTSITGVDAKAAFLFKMFTSNLVKILS